jgi:hypothetical protein
LRHSIATKRSGLQFPMKFYPGGSMRYAVIALSLILAGFGAAPAFATPIDASTILQDFNAVIYTNATTSSDIEGAAVIGGNYNGATFYNNPTTSVPAGYAALPCSATRLATPTSITEEAPISPAHTRR